MGRVTHFDISALDADRAINFYSKTFHWKFKKWNDSMDYWQIQTGPGNEPGIDGGMQMREKDNYVVDTIHVDSIDKTLSDVKDYGGKIVMDKHTIESMGFYAQFEDPEGNLLGLWQDDKSAK